MIYVAADIHSIRTRVLELESRARDKYGTSPGEGDIVVVCGDLLGKYERNPPKELLCAGMSLLMHREAHPSDLPLAQREEDMAFLDWIAKRPYTVLAVHGNHDRAECLLGVGEMANIFGGRARKVAENVYYLDDGGEYEIPAGDGTTISLLSLGGACGHLARFGIGCGKKTKMDYVAEAAAAFGKSFDVVASHEGPLSHLGVFRLLYGANAVNTALDVLAEGTEHKHWFYGHHHADKKTKKGFTCLYKDIVRL